MTISSDTQAKIIDFATDLDNVLVGIEQAVREQSQNENGDGTIPERYTDTVLADDLSRQLYGRALYWREAGKWLIWDGRRWCPNAPGGMHPIVQKYINNLLVKISNSETLDTDTRSRYYRAVCRYEYFNRQEILIKTLSVIPAMIANSHKIDANPMLLTCLNGTVDLSNGILLPHSQTDLITQLCCIDYQRDATCPTFKDFLQNIFAGNLELISYIKRLAGYCLTGRTDEQIMAFFYGTGRNGKTTLVNVLLMLLDDFARSAQAELLMQKNQEGANNELARLSGTRLVAVNEVEEGARLAEAQLKTLTGGDKVTARFLYQEYFEYDPQFKLILVGNHKPQVRNRDLGIWRRIHLIPFTVTIPENECDPKLLEKLKAELPGILAWAVEGCIEWQLTGLKPPAAILNATDQYRKAEDVLEMWLQECCDLGESYAAESKVLLAAFVEFSSWKHMSPKKFGQLLSENGFIKHNNGCVRSWQGIRLKR